MLDYITSAFMFVRTNKWKLAMMENQNHWKGSMRAQHIWINRKGGNGGTNDQGRQISWV